MQRRTGYARLGSQRVAYEVVGDGPIDLVLTSGSWGAFDTDWEDPVAELFFRRLASFSRLIRFDRRGTGASDPLASTRCRRGSRSSRSSSASWTRSAPSAPRS